MADGPLPSRLFGPHFINTWAFLFTPLLYSIRENFDKIKDLLIKAKILPKSTGFPAEHQKRSQANFA